MKLYVIISLPIIFSLVIGNELTEEFRVVQTNYGPVQGALNVTLFDNKRYYSFRGIPFAKPPLGQLRFKVMLIWLMSSNIILKTNPNLKSKIVTSANRFMD